MYKRALNNVKMVLYSEQFGLEVTSREFAHILNDGNDFVRPTKTDLNLRHIILFIFYNRTGIGGNW